MSDGPSVRLPFGTVAALFPSPQAAETATANLAARGYPRELISVLMGRPWQDGAATETGFVPDPELRFQLAPASSLDTPPGAGMVSPALASFAGSLVANAGRRRDPATWPVVTLAVGVVAVVIAFARGDWMAVTIALLVAFHVVVAVAVMAYVRGRQPTFPFRERIPEVDAALEQGGVLVTVRCTLPYTHTVETALTSGGGQVLGYARDTVYPVPA